MKTDIFADDCDCHFMFGMGDRLYKVLPVRKINRSFRKIQLTAYNRREILFFQHQRCFIKIRYGCILNDTIRFDIAEKRNLCLHIFGDMPVASCHDEIGPHPEILQLLDGVLGRF